MDPAHDILAVAGELVERAVAQPDLRAFGRQLGLEPDVGEHPHDPLEAAGVSPGFVQANDRTPNRRPASSAAACGSSAS